MKQTKLTMIAVSLALSCVSAANADQPKQDVAEKALAMLAERGDQPDRLRPVRAFFYGSNKNIAGVARALEKDGWTDIQEFPDPQKGPPFVVATRPLTGERTVVLDTVGRLEALAASHRVTLEALEVPPVR